MGEDDLSVMTDDPGWRWGGGRAEWLSVPWKMRETRPAMAIQEGERKTVRNTDAGDRVPSLNPLLLAVQFWVRDLTFLYFGFFAIFEMGVIIVSNSEGYENQMTH